MTIRGKIEISGFWKQNAMTLGLIKEFIKLAIPKKVVQVTPTQRPSVCTATVTININKNAVSMTPGIIGIRPKGVNENTASSAKNKEVMAILREEILDITYTPF